MNINYIDYKGKGDIDMSAAFLFCSQQIHFYSENAKLLTLK